MKFLCYIFWLRSVLKICRVCLIIRERWVHTCCVWLILDQLKNWNFSGFVWVSCMALLNRSVLLLGHVASVEFKWPIVTGRFPPCLCVRRSVGVNCGKMADWICMLFGVVSRVGPRMYRMDGVLIWQVNIGAYWKLKPIGKSVALLFGNAWSDQADIFCVVSGVVPQMHIQMGVYIPYRLGQFLGVLMPFGYYWVFRLTSGGKTYSICVRKVDNIFVRTTYQRYILRVFKDILHYTQRDRSRCDRTWCCGKLIWVIIYISR